MAIGDKTRQPSKPYPHYQPGIQPGGQVAGADIPIDVIQNIVQTTVQGGSVTVGASSPIQASTGDDADEPLTFAGAAAMLAAQALANQPADSAVASPMPPWMSMGDDSDEPMTFARGGPQGFQGIQGLKGDGTPMPIWMGAGDDADEPLTFTPPQNPTGVTPGTYGSATAVPEITVNALGQITAASTAAITASSAAGPTVPPYMSMGDDADEPVFIFTQPTGAIQAVQSTYAIRVPGSSSTLARIGASPATGVNGIDICGPSLDLRFGCFSDANVQSGACYQGFSNSNASFPGQMYFDCGNNASSAGIFRYNAGTSATEVFRFNSTGLVVASGFNCSFGGKVTKYNNIATALGGMPAILATSDLTAQSAAVAGQNLYTTPANGGARYRINWAASITTAATNSAVLGGASGFQVSFTDYDSNTATVATDPTLTSSVNAVGTQINGVVYIVSKQSSAINYSLGYTSVGVTAMQFAVRVSIELIG